MADFKKAFEIVKRLEFKDPSNALHKNPGEDGWTFMGVYQKAHPNSGIWKELARYQAITNDTKELSRLLYNNNAARNEVERIYKTEYWDKARGDEIASQQIADEIFIFGVNAGMKRAIKAAQEIVGVKPDGVIGPVTLKALNAYSEKLFDILFDASEAEYYASLAAQKERFAKFEDGWLNRAKAV